MHHTRVLVRDCLDYMKAMHHPREPNLWGRPRRSSGGQLNQKGRDREAIAGILWHSFHTNWFEYNAGSRLIHFRFSERYRNMARDGVEVFSSALDQRRVMLNRSCPTRNSE